MDDGSPLLFAPWKLSPPELPVARCELPIATRLAAAVERVPYVSVVAPAGFGKSTALAAWSAMEGDRRPVWVRLDPQDDDVNVLCAAIAASVRRTFECATPRVDRLLTSSTSPEVDQLADALALDMEQLDGIVVVLDDLQFLRSEESLSFVEHLVDGLAPSGRIVTASRVEPPFNLIQRRVRRNIAEFTGSDLRLDRAQVAGLLAECGLPDGALTDEILERSGGWAAAAVLLAAHPLSPTTPDRRRSSTLLVGDLDVGEFLRVEVLARMDRDLEDFVLETSILAWLDLETCSAVTGTDRAAELLEQVRRHGLTERASAPSGAATGMMLRYHDCFVGPLRAELAARRSPEQRLALHRRAAVVSPPMRAIELLLEVGDVDGAASTVSSISQVLLDTPGSWVPRSWLTPFSESQLAAHPWLAVLSGLSAVEVGDMATAQRLLAPAVASMRANGDRSGFVRSAYGLAEAHLAWGQVDEAAALIEELLGGDASPDERARVLMGKLWLAYFRGDWVAVEGGLDEAFSLALGSCTESGRCAVALGLGTEFLFAPRGVTWLSDRAAELARRPIGDVMAITNLELLGAAADLITGRIDRAQAVSVSLDERALELGSLNWLAMAADRVRLGVALALGDLPTVDAIVDAARVLLGESDRHHQERAMYAYALARSGPAADRPERVRAARVLLGDVSEQDRPDTAMTAAVLDAIRHRDEGDLDAAEAALVAVGDLHHQVRFCLLTGLVDLELAAVRLAAGRTAEAVDTARPTLGQLSALDAVTLLSIDGRDTHRAVMEACRTDPEVGGFAGYALAHLTEPSSASGLVVPDTGERLTTRELEVVRLVIGGASNRSIAEQLYIGERTVKSHMTSLMRKLAVTSRTAAVARCRELGVG